MFFNRFSTAERYDACRYEQRCFVQTGFVKAGVSGEDISWVGTSPDHVSPPYCCFSWRHMVPLRYQCAAAVPAPCGRQSDGLFPRTRAAGARRYPQLSYVVAERSVAASRFHESLAPAVSAASFRCAIAVASPGAYNERAVADLCDQRASS